MGSSLSFMKNLFIPACISLALYILISFLILPFFHRYRRRYSQYLPLETISAHTVSLRDRMADTAMRIFLPSTWRWPWRRGQGRERGRDWRWGRGSDEHGNTHESAQPNTPDADNVSIFDEEGEIMVGMNMDSASARREAIERMRRNSNNNNDVLESSQGRLSRDLEEGFMDDSDDDGDSYGDTYNRGDGRLRR